MGDAEQLHICQYNQTISAYYLNNQAQQLPFLGLCLDRSISIGRSLQHQVLGFLP
jgi:hypothetical protein